MCIYKKDSEPVFLRICKQSACSQNSHLNLTQLHVTKKNQQNVLLVAKYICGYQPNSALPEADGK